MTGSPQTDDALLRLLAPELRPSITLSYYNPADQWKVDVSSVTHFEVCAHCGPLEMATDEGYAASLWPCDTYAAVAAALEEQP